MNTCNEQSQKKWGDIFKRNVETLAVDGYRSGAFNGSQVRNILRLRTRVEAHAFMKRAGVYLDYIGRDLQ